MILKVGRTRPYGSGPGGFSSPVLSSRMCKSNHFFLNMKVFTSRCCQPLPFRALNGESFYEAIGSTDSELRKASFLL